MTFGPWVVAVAVPPPNDTVAVADRSFHTICGSTARDLAVASTISFCTTPLGDAGFLPTNGPGAHDTLEPPAPTVAVPPACSGVADVKVMPSTAGTVTVAPDTGSVLVLVSVMVAGNTSPGFTQPFDDTNW